MAGTKLGFMDRSIQAALPPLQRVSKQGSQMVSKSATGCGEAGGVAVSTEPFRWFPSRGRYPAGDDVVVHFLPVASEWRTSSRSAVVDIYLETVRLWSSRFGPTFAGEVGRRRPGHGPVSIGKRPARHVREDQRRMGYLWRR